MLIYFFQLLYNLLTEGPAIDLWSCLNCFLANPASNSTDFNQILNIASSGHVQTIQNVIKDTSPSQEHPNHHQLQPKIYKCHQSLRGFLMPSNSSDFNQILNIAPSGHMQTIHNVIKDTSPSQEHQNHHQLQPKIYRYCFWEYAGKPG